MSTPGDSQAQWDPNTQTMPPKPRNGMGTAALVFGVLALLSCWFPVIGFVLGLVAIILGVIGRGRVKKMRATNGGVALTGLVLGVLSLLVNILVTLVVGIGLFAVLSVGGGQVAGQYFQCASNAFRAGTPAAVQQALQQCQDVANQQLPQFSGGGQGG